MQAHPIESDEPSPPLGIAKVTPLAPGWSYAAVGVGAVLVALGAAVMGIVAIASIASKSAVAMAVWTMAGGGTILAIGWGAMVPSGRAGPGVVLGGLALPAGAIVAHLVHVPAAYSYLLGLIWLAGVFVFVMTHYFALGEGVLADLVVARGCAGLAMLGLGITLAAVTKKIPLGRTVNGVLELIGLCGVVLFGFVLAATIGQVHARSRGR